MQEQPRVVNEDAGLISFFGRVYTHMGLGLGLTALVSYLLGFVFKTQYLNFLGQNRWAQWVFLLLPFAMVLGISGRRAQRSSAFAATMFYALSAAYGLTFSLILQFYSAANIAVAFATTAVVFIVMSMVGRFGKRDLSKAGSIASAALIGIIIMSIVNIFMHSGPIQMLISYGILIVFIILTAWDTQNLKKLYYQVGDSGALNMNSIAVQGALMLYLDFINLFMSILQIFGGSNKD
ncbi:Bax inhibitor-1 family protein [Lacticaseibacillus brantae]|uniref:Integral membrane protein n=1 Tax=Lacticaseibacillus brantae DSM 23927 TaxID=1423727 RepID=A0A0R2B918_9LACO|nr:Bax inhibitor-1/YccA family protein [Lacticaseibacillus brantae]KRM72889.1 integral membrane protein [Lacticaseibacillus brantae DSM 23927]